MRILLWLGGRAIPLALLEGRGTPLVMLARLLGLESPPAALTLADGLKPKLRREAGPSAAEEVVVLGRLRDERTVTVAGMSLSTADRGDARGGVVVGAGSLE